jgi:hypothetical protein
MVNYGEVVVTMTPELRQLALRHVYETEQPPELDELVELLQEQETPDGFVLDAARDVGDARIIVVIARALLWSYELCPGCERWVSQRGHVRSCPYWVTT